jgi:hypothetical protein
MQAARKARARLGCQTHRTTNRLLAARSHGLRRAGATWVRDGSSSRNRLAEQVTWQPRRPTEGLPENERRSRRRACRGDTPVTRDTGRSESSAVPSTTPQRKLNVVARLGAPASAHAYESRGRLSRDPDTCFSSAAAVSSTSRESSASMRTEPSDRRLPPGGVGPGHTRTFGDERSGSGRGRPITRRVCGWRPC